MKSQYIIQNLDSASALLCLDVEKFFLETIPEPDGKLFIVALSGGADSVALALIFHILSSRRKFKLHALHINHGLRHEARQDEEFALKFCMDLGISSSCVHINTKSIACEYSCGVEDAGRRGRYDAFERYRLYLGASHVLVAHHSGDLGEDILMRIVRGCGWPALGGMKALNGHIFRPLLYTDPEKLKTFLRKNGFSWREDASNKSLDFRRNRFRHLIMPLLKKENPDIGESFISLHEQADIDAGFWDEMLTPLLDKVSIFHEKREFFLPLSLLKSRHPAIRLRLYHKLLEQARQINPDAGCRAQTLFKLDASFELRQTGKVFQFPGNVKAILRRDGIAFVF